MKARTYVAKALHNLPALDLTKGQKCFVDFSNCNIRTIALPSDERDGNVVFRLTNETTDYHLVDKHGEYSIVVPDGARVKQALWKIAQPTKELRIEAIAQMKEMYLHNKLRAKSFTPDSEFSDAMENFRRYCDNNEEQFGSDAFSMFCKLAERYNNNRVSA